MTKQLLFLMSPSEAEKFSRQVAAAEAGDGAAACHLGDCYRTGRPVAASPRRAFRWYLRGTWAGDADAMNNLGACYHNGFGCKKSMSNAIHWYRRAINADSVEACDNLGRCCPHDRDRRFLE
jgi:TPR repeat protein